jgi:hypothetical protein
MAFFAGPAMAQPETVLSNVLGPSAAPEAASAAEALGPEPFCAAASPAVIKPKSTAAVAKASVVTAAPPQRAAVPKLSAAASMPSADLKPSATAFKLAADTTSLKVSICYVCLYTHNGSMVVSCHVRCSVHMARRKDRCWMCPPSIDPYIYLPITILSISLRTYQSTCLPIYLFILFFYLSSCLSIYLSLCLSDHPFIHPSRHINFLSTTSLPT